MAFTAAKEEAPVLALGLIFTPFGLSLQCPGVTAFGGCHLVQAQLSPGTHLDPLRTRDSNSKGSPVGYVAQVQMYVHLPEPPLVRPCLGRQTEGPHRRERFLDPRKSCSGHTQVTSDFKEERGAEGRGETYRWVAGVDTLGGRFH